MDDAVRSHSQRARLTFIDKRGQASEIYPNGNRRGYGYRQPFGPEATPQLTKAVNDILARGDLRLLDE